MSDQRNFDWIQRAKDAGLEAPLRLTLDALEPFAPLGAQVMWTLQPALGVFFQSETVRALAETLEDPDGIARLRQQLEDEAIQG